MTHFKPALPVSSKREVDPKAIIGSTLSQTHLDERLHGLARYGDGYLIEEAIRKGADVNGRSDGSFSTTPLMSAVRGKRVCIVRLLLDLGADPLREDNAGWDALKWTAVGGEIDSAKAIVEHLRSKGEDILRILNRPDINGQGTMDLAYMHPQMQEYLASIGAVRLR